MSDHNERKQSERMRGKRLCEIAMKNVRDRRTKPAAGTVSESKIFQNAKRKMG